MILVIMLAGGFGACCRYLVDTALKSWFPGSAWGTVAVNTVGSFLLGVVIGRGQSEIALIVGTGFCGGFTTFSTAMVENVRILRAHPWRGIAFGLGLFGVCLAAAALGLALSAPSIG